MARKKYLHLLTLVTAFFKFEICLKERDFLLFALVLFPPMCSCYSGFILGEWYLEGLLGYDVGCVCQKFHYLMSDQRE